MKLKNLTTKNFSKYGWIIEYPKIDKYPEKNKITPPTKNLFRIIVKETKKIGWRLAYLIIKDKKIRFLEKHPKSLESFEPVKGKTLIYVTTTKNKTSIESFYLDKPVILKKGVWHGVVTLGKVSEVKIAENADVTCIYWDLKEELLIPNTSSLSNIEV